MKQEKRSARFKKLQAENRKLEKEAPYNFCDRWCQRCTHEKQVYCRLYQDEYERNLTCIAYGRDPGDSEVVSEILKKQYEPIDELLQKHIDEYQLDTDDIDDSQYKEYEEQQARADNDSLTHTAQKYLDKSHVFLTNTFQNPDKLAPEVKYDLETVSWYHTLLFVKLKRALTDFHEAPSEDEFGLSDAIAQFSVCCKAINESDSAFRRLVKTYTQYQPQIVELLAILSNIKSRIDLLEQAI